MDPIGDFAILGDQTSLPKWNVYSSKTLKPVFRRSERPHDPIIDNDVYISLVESSVNVSSSLTLEDSDVLFKSIDPFLYAIQKRGIAHNRDYYSLLHLDRQLGIFTKGCKVLTFTPYPMYYLKEKGCNVFLTILGIDQIEEDFEFESFEEVTDNPYTSYVRTYSKTYPNHMPNLKVETSLAFSTLDERFEVFERQEETKLYRLNDVIILTEETYGRTEEYFDEDEEEISTIRPYDLEFFEPAVRGLNLLANGGSIIVTMMNYMSRMNADLIFLYKYLFSSVMVSKLSTQKSVDGSYYVVCKGFKRDVYLQMKDATDQLLESMMRENTKAIHEDEEFLPTSFISNTFEDKNFYKWMLDTNNDIGVWMFINISALAEAMNDRRFGFREGHPFFLYDYVSYREQLGFPGRETLKLLPDAEYSDKLEVAKEVQQSLPEIKFVNLDQKKDNIKLFIALRSIVQQVYGLEITNQRSGMTMNPEMIREYRLNMALRTKEWLGLLYYSGDLTKYLNSTPEDNFKSLNEAKWNISQILTLVDSKYATSTMANLLSGGKKLFELIDRLNILDSLNLKISPLEDLRFRLAINISGSASPLLAGMNPSIAGEYEIMNTMMDEELKQVEVIDQLAFSLDNPLFAMRLLDYICLPSFFSGNQTELAASNLYFKYKPGIEGFASATNRHAPVWCSPYAEDVKLGSQGSFFGEFSNPKNPIFRQHKLMILFPPSNPRMFHLIIEKMSAILLGNNDADFAIILVVVKNTTYTDCIAIQSSDSKITPVQTEIVNELYMPYTGEIIDSIDHMACLYKTQASTFELKTTGS